MKARKAFKYYIEYIQFPYFRNLERNTKISFDFPLTIFVGQNGSGKSSTLHALYGAPKKNTPFEFWFSTAVDPILEVSDGGDRHSFFYVYRDNRGDELEVLKQRIFKRNNPDYWETARPNLSYGMKKIEEGKRNRPVEKEVVYIDFRAELSAFDKYFYFKQPRKTKKINNKQDFLRKYSVFLKRIIDGQDQVITRYRTKQNDPLRNLSTTELRDISFILGKNYISGKIVRHKLFEEWGYSVIFETSTFSYSEAFAGSGEMAVVRLVLEVLGASRYALVLLDEPEVSLHPGAQKRLKEFLLEQIRVKQLQVIVSTHSPSLIEDLPPQAIKVFSQLPSGKFFVKNEMLPDEAFYHIEQTNPTRKTIIVEDVLAKEIIISVLNKMGAETSSLFIVTFYTGGATVLKGNFIPVYSLETVSNRFIIFDGDQRPPNQHFDPDKIIATQQTNSRYKQEILDQTGSDVRFYPDGNTEQGAREDQEKYLRERYLKYYLRNVFYLPLNKPEDIIWNQNLAIGILRSLQKQEAIEALEKSEPNSKEKFSALSIAMTGDNTGIESLQKTFLNHWLQQNDANYDAIVKIINTIRMY